MTIGVVNVAEMVQIRHYNGNGVIVSSGSLDFLTHKMEKPPPVVNSR